MFRAFAQKFLCFFVLLLLSSYSCPHIRVCCSFSVHRNIERNEGMRGWKDLSGISHKFFFLGIEHQHVGPLNHIYTLQSRATKKKPISSVFNIASHIHMSGDIANKSNILVQKTPKVYVTLKP